MWLVASDGMPPAWTLSSELAERLNMRLLGHPSGGLAAQERCDKAVARDRKKGGVQEFGIIEFVVQPAVMTWVIHRIFGHKSTRTRKFHG